MSVQKLHLTQEEEVTANETTPEDVFDTSVLSSDLVGTKPEVDAFDGKNFLAIAESYAADCGAAWQRFEKTNCGPLVDNANWLTTALASWPSEKTGLLASRDEALAQAGSKLKDGIKAGLRKQLNGEPVPTPKKSANQLKLEEAEKELRDLRKSTTGDPNGHIDRKDPKTKFWLGGLFTLVMGVGETLGGFDIMRSLGTRAGAFGLSLLITVGFAFLSLMAAVECKLILGYITARITAKRKFGTQGLASLHVLEMEKWVLGLGGFGFLLLTVFGLLSWRTSVVANNPLLKGSEVAVFIIAAAILITFFAEMWVSPAHDPRHAKKEAELIAALKEAKAKVASEEDAKGPKAPTDPLEAAIFTYHQTVESADASLSEMVAEIKGGIEDRALLVDLYKGIRQSVVFTIYRQGIGNLLAQLDGQMDFDKAAFMEDGRIMTYIRTACPLSLLSKDLDAGIAAFDPTFPVGKIEVEMDKLTEDLRKEVAEEVRSENENAAARQREEDDRARREKLLAAKKRLKSIAPQLGEGE